MKYCNKCNKSSEMNDNFCYICGEKLEDFQKCECGTELHPVDKFCPNCGKKVLNSKCL